MSQEANEITALPCCNGTHIVSETIGCFGWHPRRLIPMVFNPQVAIMARKAAPSGLPLKHGISVEVRIWPWAWKIHQSHPVHS